ncbi:MAG: sulfite exporter TauE/SafE family protein [Gammaproteobacteria bacterium]|nr:sulfite exporter TauE/SafE family protein [Gammaproteobacteria bacterium]
MSLSIFNAFIVGLFSTLHCLGMCGGIIGTLTMSLPESVRNNNLRLLSYTSTFNLGRLLSYALAGLIAGAFGQTVMEAISPRYAHIILQVFATLIMVGIGIHLAGWFPRFNLIEKIGTPLWRKLEPFAHRLLPVQKPSQAFLFGLVWGWLPCGLVYAALIWSTSAGDATHGALFMLAFGAGTLLPVMTAGMLTGWMVRMSHIPNIKPIIGSIIIVMALLSLGVTLQQGVSDTHTHQTHGGH